MMNPLQLIWPTNLKASPSETTGVPGEAVNQSGVLCAGRDDTAPSNSSVGGTDCPQSVGHRLGDKAIHLIVTRDTGMFTLTEITAGVIKVVVKAPAAQMIQDYLNANWPVGTVAQWVIMPPFRNLCAQKPHVARRAAVYTRRCGAAGKLPVIASARASFFSRKGGSACPQADDSGHAIALGTTRSTIVRASLGCLVIAIALRIVFDFVVARF